MKVEIDYTNYRGERRLRKILPLRWSFGQNAYHKDGEQWFVTAVDLETEQIRTFAMKDKLWLNKPVRSEKDKELRNMFESLRQMVEK